MAGKQYTSSHPSAGLYDPRATLEKILRPIENYQQRRDQALAKLRAPPEQEEESGICWGGPGNFTFEDIDGGGVKTSPDDDEPQPNQGILNWSEHSRAFKNIRVENPDDSEQYVIVQRIEWIAFTAPGADPRTWACRVHKYTLRHPDAKKKK